MKKHSKFDPKSDPERFELFLQQEQLIDALLGIGDCPSEVDSAQVKVCALSLKNKRTRVLQKLSGDDRTECGAIPIEMASYFKAYPGVHPDGGFADLRRFKRFKQMRRLKALFGFGEL